MNAYFFDSSAVIKKYARETGTNWIIGLFRETPANIFYAARITAAEVASAIARRRRGRSLTAKQGDHAKRRFKRDFHGRFFKIEITVPIIEKAEELADKHFLRGYDAVQLAAALQAQNIRNSGGGNLIFVCADNALRQAASAESLLVEDPNLHP